MPDTPKRSFVDKYFKDLEGKVHFGKVLSVAAGAALGGAMLYYLLGKDADPETPGRQTTTR
jgi:hypothetical protein